MQEKMNTTNQTPLSSDEMKLLVMLGRALSDLTRIRILGLLGVRSMYGKELAQTLDIAPPTVSHHLSPLISAGLVKVRRENNYTYYELDSEGIQQLGESTQHIAKMLFTIEALPPKSEERARVVATFIKKRRYIMEELARSFEWGRLYDEKEVNAILRAFHDDVASLRREMIDQRIMMRESDRYWLVRPHI